MARIYIHAFGCDDGMGTLRKLHFFHTVFHHVPLANILVWVPPGGAVSSQHAEGWVTYSNLIQIVW